MFHPRRLLAAITAVLALGTAAACGAPAPDQSAAPQEGGRIVDHAMGRTEVPGTPRRVVVLDTGELDAALALVRVESARQCRDAARSLDEDLLLEAFRQADFALNHLAVGEDLASAWSVVED